MLESLLIPIEDRTAPAYAGYSLSVLIADLLAHCKEIESAK